LSIYVSIIHPNYQHWIIGIWNNNENATESSTLKLKYLEPKPNKLCMGSPCKNYKSFMKEIKRELNKQKK
jgi:hypothetical protein